MYLISLIIINPFGTLYNSLASEKIIWCSCRCHMCPVLLQHFYCNSTLIIFPINVLHNAAIWNAHILQIRKLSSASSALIPFYFYYNSISDFFTLLAGLLTSWKHIKELSSAQKRYIYSFPRADLQFLFQYHLDILSCLRIITE